MVVHPSDVRIYVVGIGLCGWQGFATAYNKQPLQEGTFIACFFAYLLKKQSVAHIFLVASPFKGFQFLLLHLQA